MTPVFVFDYEASFRGHRRDAESLVLEIAEHVTRGEFALAEKKAELLQRSCHCAARRLEWLDEEEITKRVVRTLAEWDARE